MTKATPAYARVIASGLDFLAVAINKGYLQRTIPNSRDDQIAQLLGDFGEMTDDERALVMARIDRGGASVLRCYAERMANLSVRTKDSAPAYCGLRALALAWRAEWDQREIWVVMGPVFDALGRSGADARRAFRAAGALFPEDVAREFDAFAERNDLDEIAEVMGYVDGNGPDGFRYKRTW